MANALNVKPTLMELSNLKESLDVAERGHKLLKDKQDELMRQFIDLIKENNELRKQVEEELSGALQNFVLASSTMNDAFVDELVAIPTQEATLEIHRKNVMSVTVPEMQFHYSEEKEDKEKDLSYGYLNTSSELYESLNVMNAVLPNLLKLSEIEKTCQLMADEIESTRRRVNALEYRMIPDHQETIKYIEMKLEEDERASITRMMKVKDMGEEE